VGAVPTLVAPSAGFGDVGADGGEDDVEVWTATLSKVDVLICDVSWLSAIKPTSALAGNDAVVVPTSVQVLPFPDT
jgi:hypothetical protein